MKPAEPILECCDCRWWKPKDNSHLCLEGKCVLIKDYSVPITRNAICKIDFRPIDERGMNDEK